MFTVGILPAGGRAERFGGVLKEMLPTKDGVSFMRHAADRLLTDVRVVITTAEKMPLHVQAVPEGLFMLKRGEEMWTAVYAALSIRADRYYFTMPDTYLRGDVFARNYEEDFVLGTFKTKTPERFGVIRDGHVVDKQFGEPGQAWGVLEWSDKVANLWRMTKPPTYTDAINLAMSEFGYKTFDIGAYYDNASLRDYQAYLIGEG